MLKLILIILFLLLFLVLLIPFLLLSIVWRILSWFGIVRKPRTNVFYRTWQAGWRTSASGSTASAEQDHSSLNTEEKKRMFDKGDGEYVEFEEIKDEER